MDLAEFAIVALNVLLGFGFAWPLAGPFSRLKGGTARPVRAYVTLVIVYALECVAFAASMATDILSIGLAVLWGLFLGIRIRRAGPAFERARRTVVRFALYTALPAVSFLSVPIMAAIAGRSILAAPEGARFGIPGFVPWPLNTILGFCVAVASIGLLLKLTITTGLASIVAGRTGR
jgi:hypothetical protein